MQKLFNIFLIENVPQYAEEIVIAELGDEYSTKTCVIDPRLFGLPTARSRRYIIAWRKAVVTWISDIKLEDVIEALTAHVVAEAGIFWWMDCPKSNLTEAQAGMTSCISFKI